MVKTTLDSVILAPTQNVAVAKLTPGTLVVVRTAPDDVPIVGTVARADASTGTIIFDGGQTVSTTRDSLIFAPLRPVKLRSLEPGTVILTSVSQPVAADRRITGPPLVVATGFWSERSGGMEYVNVGTAGGMGTGELVKQPRAVALKDKEYTKYALGGGTAMAGIRIPPAEEEGVYALPGGVIRERPSPETEGP